jgi:hypothetical protein
MQLQENKEEQSMATEARETAGLIGSDKVEGTYVYDAKGENIGSIERVMIEKVSGQVAYAVLQFGGFLGIGSDYYPIPWQSLKYDTSLGGYRTNITEEQLKGAPKYSGTSWDWEDRARGRQVYDYYGASWREY